MAKRFESTRNIELHTEASAAGSTTTAANTGGLAQQFSTSALSPSSRCGLVHALVPPLQRVPRRVAPRATAAERQAIGATRLPRCPALDLGMGARDTIDVTLNVDGEKLGWSVERAKDRYPRSSLRRG